MRWITGRLVTLVAALLVCAPSAFAVNPEQTVSGIAGSQWYSGSLSQQYGLNCSIIGGSYSEVMTSAIGGYGGTPSVVGVGQKYWATLLVATVGNPCGSGSAGVQTDLFLPVGTQIDTTRPIRCFYLPRNSNDTTNGWIDGTNETWTMQGVGSGRICPTGVGPSTLSAGGYQVGFRPVPSGLLLKIFVPVVSSQALSGQALDWLVSSTAAYETPRLTRTGAFVFAGISGGGGGSPSVFFSQQPAAKPYWVDGAPNTQANRVELWVNAYTAGLAGTLSYEIRRTDTNAVVWSSAAAGAAWDGSIPAGMSVVQLNPAPVEKGPNGGYSPVAFDAPGTPSNPAGEWNVPMRITWTFTPSGGSPVSNSTTFTTLAGPDKDADGVPDASDACPNAAGNGANGCAVVVENPNDDGDLDGVPRSKDLCPTVQAPGTPDGCPAPAAPQPTPTPAPPASGGTPAPPSGTTQSTSAPVVKLQLGAKPSLAKAKLIGKAGATVTASCTAGATLTVTLVATKPTARTLKLKTKPLPTLASGSAPCAVGDTSVKVVLGKALVAKIRRARGPLTATLAATVSGPSGSSAAPTIAVKLK